MSDDALPLLLTYADIADDFNRVCAKNGLMKWRLKANGSGHREPLEWVEMREATTQTWSQHGEEADGASAG